MNNFKNEKGFAFAIIVILLFLLISLSLYFVLDIFGIIQVPKEYSITQFLDTTSEVSYQAESNETENKKEKNKVVRNKVKDDVYDSDAEFHISDPVTKTSSNDYDEENYDVENDLDYNKYYYSQLDDNAKKIYDKILENKDNLTSGTYTIDFGKEFNKLLNSENGDKILNDSFQSAVNALLLDNPDIFFLDITKMYLLTKSTTYAFTGTKYEVSIGPNDDEGYLNSSFLESSVETAQSKLESIKRSILNDLEGNDIDKIKQIHDYLVENLEYDSTFSNDNIYNLYGALVNKSTVCEGYAKAFKYLLDAEGIPCVVICGLAQNTKGEIENHAWNYVLIDGAWYAVDVTWDDPIVVGGGTLSQESKYKYFLRGSDSLFNDHEEDGTIVEGADFYYPELNNEDY